MNQLRNSFNSIPEVECLAEWPRWWLGGEKSRTQGHIRKQEEERAGRKVRETWGFKVKKFLAENRYLNPDLHNFRNPRWKKVMLDVQETHHTMGRATLGCWEYSSLANSSLTIAELRVLTLPLPLTLPWPEDLWKKESNNKTPEMYLSLSNCYVLSKKLHSPNLMN